MSEETNEPAAAQPTAEQLAEQSSADAKPNLLDAILANPRMASNVPRSKELVNQFVDAVLDKSIRVSDDTVAMLQECIRALDEKIAAQVNEILHDPQFQELEAAWRGLHYLVFNTETGPKLKLRLLSVSKSELEGDLTSKLAFDTSQLFKKIYEEEYGTFGGNPFSLLLGGYEFDRHDIGTMGLLAEIAGVAAAAHAPFIAAASPKLFDMQAFGELGNPRDLSKVFETTEMAGWRDFQNMEDSRYVTLIMPHVLLRKVYGAEPDQDRVDGFGFQEDTDGTDPKKYLWGNAAYAMVQRITNAFALYGWCAAIRGVEGGGIVDALPTHLFTNVGGDKSKTGPAEVVITDRREYELSNLGFVALCNKKNENFAVFFGGQTTQKPIAYITDAATANALLSARLPYILAASRFAHYLKVLCRDKIGSFQTKESLQEYLNQWISQYVLATDNAGQEMKAKYPLREARIDVKDKPGHPGSFSAVAYLRPHFQMEDLTTSVRLVAELPPPAAA